jgi:transposase-like protein
MSEQKRRRFSGEFKLKVIERLEAGESGTALALELSIKRTIIYRWRDQVTVTVHLTRSVTCVGLSGQVRRVS